MNANRQLKVDSVKEISEKLTNSSSVVVASYTGLTVKEFETLRLELIEKGVNVKVYKNRLFKIAAKDAGFGDINASLTGQNLYAFGTEDEIAPAKIIFEFAKAHSALVPKVGIYEGKYIDEEELKVVASLPSFEEALTMLASSLMAPLKQVSVGLNMLVEEGHLEGSNINEEPTAAIAE